MSHEKRLGWATLVLGLLGVAASILWPQQRWIGWMFFAGAIGSGVAWLYLELQSHIAREIKSVIPAQRITAADWKELASRFENVPVSYVRAEWLSEGLDWNGNVTGERWDIRNEIPEFARQCEVLCQLAGKMLLSSSTISPTLSEKVRSRSNDAGRWLYFLDERKMARIRGDGETTVGVQRKKTTMKEISQLPGKSALVCIECAAKEI
jgi:hypothetical protein